MNLLNPKSYGFIFFFLRAYPGRSALMVVLLAISGLAEGVSVATLVPLLELAGGAGGQAEPSTLGAAVTAFLGWFGLRPTLAVLVSLIVVGITLKAVFLWLAMRQVGYTVARVTMDLRLSLVRALLRARWRYFSGQPVGRFANAISSEAIRAASAYREACVVLASVLQVAVYLALSTLMSATATLVALVAGALFIVLLRRLVTMSRAAGEQQTIRTKSLTEALVDALRGIKPIKAMGREKQFLPLFEHEARELNEAHRGQVLASETLKLFQEPMVALVLGAGMYVVLQAGAMPFSSVMVMAFVFYRLMQYINTIQTRYQIMAVGESAFWSLRDSIDRAEDEREQTDGRSDIPDLASGIELESISFSYEDEPLLEDLSLSIPAGSFVTVAGPSGVGKTTVADLIIGLQRPQGGRILVDGVPLEAIDLKAWRGVVGYVPQEVLLFNDTIRRNVTLGDDEISDEEVIEALRAADAWDFVRSRPGGLDTEVGEQGVRFSGGQRQRLSIARALVTRPRLLILDEATTALDPATEEAICETLRRLRDRVTVLSISHQPAMRRTADVVYMIEKGQARRADRAMRSAHG